MFGLFKEMWYRGVVNCFIEHDRVGLYFIDFGNEDVVRFAKETRPFHSRFLERSPMALKCQLPEEFRNHENLLTLRQSISSSFKVGELFHFTITNTLLI